MQKKNALIIGLPLLCLLLPMGCHHHKNGPAPAATPAPQPTAPMPLLPSLPTFPFHAAIGPVVSISSSTNFTPGYWQNGTWNSVTPPADSQGTCICSFAVSGSDIYVAGGYINGSRLCIPGYWKNGTWTALTQNTANSSANSVVSSLVISSGGDVYAASSPVVIDGNISTTPAPCLWKNATPRFDLTLPTGAASCCITSLIISGSNIYAGGYYTNSSNPSFNVPGYWTIGTDGTNSAWNPLGLPAGANTSADSCVNCMAASSNGDVYVGGFYTAGSIYIGAYAKIATTGTTWTALSSPVTTLPQDAMVNCLTISGTSVYAGGYAGNANNANICAPGYWKDGSWVSLTPLSPSLDSMVQTIAVSGTDVYAAGYTTYERDLYCLPCVWQNANLFGLANSQSGPGVDLGAYSFIPN